MMAREFAEGGGEAFCRATGVCVSVGGLVHRRNRRGRCGPSSARRQRVTPPAASRPQALLLPFGGSSPVR